MKKLAIILSVFLNIQMYAQIPFIEDYHKKVESYPRTQVYLQISKGLYEAGEEIWFKAYVMDSHSLTPTSQDTTLYVELLKADDKSVMMQDRLFIVGGFAAGNFILPASFLPGEYVLAAYTTHSFRQNEPEFKAYRNISVRDPQITVVRKNSNNFPKDVKIDFFPEGGYLVSGLGNSVAFKAVDTSGYPVEVSGVLYGGTDSLLSFNSAHLGMGKLEFIPEKGKRYFTKLNGLSEEYILPEALDSGVILKKTRPDNTFTAIKSKDLNLDKVIIIGQMRGQVFTAYSGGFKNDSLVFRIPPNKFPVGLAEITLLTEDGTPLAERLVFVNQDKNLAVQVSISKDTSQVKEKVILDILTKDSEGSPAVAHLGLSVYDVFYEHKYAKPNILSYNHLSAQIKGNIVNPEYYFDTQNENRKEALDLLLMTQGWRRYVWGMREMKLLPEPVIILPNYQTGKVTVRKDMPGSMIVVDYEGKPDLSDPIVIEKDGRFILSPYNMMKGDTYIKLVGQEDDFSRYKVQLEDSFKPIGILRKGKKFSENTYFVIDEKPVVMSAFYGAKALKELVIKGRGKDYNNRYMAKLDSMARSVKVVSGTDYVCRYGILNCPNHSYGDPPIEGKMYTVLNGNTRSVVVYGTSASRYSEEDLMRMHGMRKISGYQRYREFYQPDYEAVPEEKKFPDLRSTLVWNPEIITNQEGKARVEFYTSDITGKFKGVLEGLDGYGRMGVQTFHFFVKE